MRHIMMLCKNDAILTHIGGLFMDYQKLYFHLFNAITDALNQMELQNYGQAAVTLVAAQQQTEDWYMEED